ncbi:XisH family protein [Nostoc sp. FACHB-87]|uniref:XisH family protein n=1 Tax=Nostocales TaxID=1161 RepID=UPI001682E1BF|nr:MULTISPECIES: XisH family protein [Nostocales]MBD2458974.1 XisH family protein [Nostoc sp. FACHB-87]MBD2480128.1 XisH family protein [Anabaena sp. FACHB-83]MBD2490549.1 XisH family protein [Aulosira sp. FACHB-615]
MAAKDTYHEAVKNALIKDGWTITFDPYPIRYEEVKLLADLAGEKTISATREGELIVIEIKSFLGRSNMREFETALGQYLIYQTFLNITNPSYKIYLAISKKIYEQFFQQVAIQLIIQKYQVLLLVVDINKQEIFQWTK